MAVMATKKPRTNITLFESEKAKLEKLSELWGMSQSRVVGRLLREAKISENNDIGDISNPVQADE